MSMFCRARTHHFSLGRLVLVLMGMLVVCLDALALSRPALPSQRRAGTNALSRCALVEMKEPIGLHADEVVEGTPGFDMKQHYEEHYDKERCPLFRDWTTYAASLPVRRTDDGYFSLRLHNLQHWSNPSDIDSMAHQLLVRKRGKKGIRGWVKYVCAPGMSGKTKSVLPAFLAGRKTPERPDGFTHYLYLACDNNQKRNYKLRPSKPNLDPTIASEQGAAFMLSCMKTLLNDSGNGSFRIPPEDDPVDIADTVDELKELLHTNLGPGFKVLIHIDEHHKMCYRPETNSGKSEAAESSAAFPRGAMSALASTRGVTVVASYTNRVDLPASKSAAVCRDPIMLPPIDPGIIMNAIPELLFENHPTPEDEFYFRCQWATLRLRLAFYVQSEGLPYLHARNCNIPATDAEFEEFLTQFRSSARFHVGKRLKTCNKLCSGKMYGLLTDITIKSAQQISQMLVAVDDDDEAGNTMFTSITRQVKELTVLEDGRLSVSLMRLLRSTDPDVELYAQGRDLLETQLTQVDMLQGTPLENAYAWALACLAAVKKELKFITGRERFVIKGTSLQAGMLFKENNESKFNLTLLQPDVIYYVNEIRGSKNTRGTPTHPIADIFFRTTDGHVVLIDVAGSNGADVQKIVKGRKRKIGISTDKVAAKEVKLVNATLKMQTEMETMEGHRGLTVHGVVLAPFDERPSTEQRSSKGNRVMVVRGNDALRLLGGLRQLSRWLQ